MSVENAAQRLVLTVASLPRAKAFLQKKGLLGTNSAREAAIDPSRTHGPRLKHVLKLVE